MSEGQEQELVLSAEDTLTAVEVTAVLVGQHFAKAIGADEDWGERWAGHLFGMLMDEAEMSKGERIDLGSLLIPFCSGSIAVLVVEGKCTGEQAVEAMGKALQARDKKLQELGLVPTAPGGTEEGA